MESSSTFTSSTIDFSVVSDAKNSKLPKLSTGDAAWKAQVCENARKIYLSVKYTNLKCVKESKVRNPVDDDASDVCESTSTPPSPSIVEPKAVSFDLEAEMALLQDKLAKMEARSRQLEDENSLLAWYAHHVKGDAAETAPSVEDILEEAKTSVLEQALATIEEAAAIKAAQ